MTTKMTILDVLRAMDRGEPLKQAFDHNGNYWVIIGEKCSGIVNAAIRRHFIKVIDGRDIAVMTSKGHEYLLGCLRAEKLKEGK